MSHNIFKLSDAESPELSDELIGETFGVYQITKEIGRGGMGVVYLAERADGAFRQDVAIKFVKRGMDTDLILKRFRNERQILAALSHPNVALLYDGGTTDKGLPYFVMEYVAGEPLYQFCDNRKLNLKERLKIFVQVCEAVHAAHQIKVVHRDLKPSNILVKANGVPKLLDFGIAKLLDSELADATIEPTATQMRMMTPEYASPEQVSGGEITTASDIYSLGVLLYELLSGHRPYRLKNRSPYEIARVICEESPESLTRSLESKETFVEKNEAKTLEKVVESRGSNLLQLRRELSGELEQIVMNALHKSPAERYQTALELAEDIGFYLKGKPIKKQLAPLPKQTNLPKDDKTSLAVLPLKNLGAALGEDAGDQYLSIGLADALITRLSRVGRLIVRPTSSVLRFGESTDPFAAGAELGVDFVVEGTIRRVGERIRVTVQLLKTADASTAWSENFDERFTDVLELEDLISEKVAQSLIPKLTGEEEKQLNKRGTNSTQAYEAFLKGRFYWNLQTEEGFARSIAYYQQAVILDQNYSQAYAAIAEYYIFLGIHCVIPFGEGALAAKEAADKAIRLDPTSAEGYAALGFAAISFELDWKKAEELFLKAVELNENSITAYFWYVALLAESRRFDEALEKLRIVSELDPTSLLLIHMTAWVLYHARRYDQSLAIYEKMLKTEQNYPWGLQTYSWLLRQIGRSDEAVVYAEKAVQLTGKNPFYLCALAAAYADAGEKEKTLQILAELDGISKTRFVSEYMIAIVYCALGNKDKAFENLEKSLAGRDGWLNWLGTEPQLDILRDDPRFADLMRRTGSPLAQPKEVLTDENAPKSIAVLPLKLFGTPTGSHEDEYLGIGLADALTTRLSNVRRLVVRPTSSVLKFNDVDANPFLAGTELGVDYVLDGNIRRAGERIRVTVQLLDIREKSSQWAENFNELFTDVLELEDSISEKVFNSLIPKLTGEEQKQIHKRGTNSPEAYEAYLKGRYHWNQFTPESLLKARELFETAIELDPSYALAYVGLADFYDWAAILGVFPTKQAIAEVEKYARQAIELDENLGEGYATLALVMQHRKQWAESEKLKLKAIELAPNYHLAHEWHASQLRGLGRNEEATREILLTERLDPLSRRTKTQVAWNFYQGRQFNEALKRGQEIIELDKNYPTGYMQIAVSLWGLKRFAEALPHFRKFNELIPDSGLTIYPLCFGLVKAGQIDEAREVLEKLKTQAQNSYIKPYFLAMAHVALGEFDEAFALFEQSFAEDDPWMLWFGSEPMLEDLRDDERYADLLRRMNNPFAQKYSE